MLKKKILAVGMLPPPYGGQALMFKRAVDALRQGYDLTVIDTQFQRNLGESGLFSVRKLTHFFVLLLGKIIPSSLLTKFDVLYYCVAGPSTLGLVKDLIFLSFLRLRARKTVYHFHGAGGVAFLLKSNAFLRCWARLALFEPDLVLRPASPPDDSILCKAKHYNVIYNCIEDPAVTTDKKAAPKWPDADLSFAFIGAITREKGVFDLVEIARLLRDKGYRFTMSLVGEGNAKEVAHLEEAISQYDLNKVVKLEGVVVGKQKFNLLRKTTIFLFPTFFRAETQPTVIMEALAVGIPAVAYDWRGISTIIDQGVNGFIVPVGDVNAFVQAIEQILNGGNIDRMRLAARRIYLERFTLDKHIEALIRAFSLVIVDEKGMEIGAENMPDVGKHV